MEKKERKTDTLDPHDIMNEGLGNDEKFQSETFRKIKGEIDDDKIESIEKAAQEDNDVTS